MFSGSGFVYATIPPSDFHILSCHLRKERNYIFYQCPLSYALGCVACELSEDLAHLFSMLSCLALMVEATGLDRQFVELFSLFDDGGFPAKIGISQGDFV